MLRAGVTAFALVLLLTAAASAQTPDQAQPNASATQGSRFAAAIAHVAQNDADLQRLYARRRFAPVWADEDGVPSDLARDALRMLDFAIVDGLDAADYHAARLRQTFNGLTEDSASRAADASAVARFDAALSRALLDYLRDLRDGRVDPRTAGYVEFESRETRGDLVLQLGDAIVDRQIVGLAEACRPHYAEYDALMIALALFRDRAQHERLPPPIPFTTSVHPGEPFAGLAALRARLLDIGELTDVSRAATNDRYDGAIVEAVKHFQGGHSLEPDGVLGKRTIAALMVPLSSRVTQLELAMERLRWLPRRLTDRMVLVNIPMFRLSAFERGAEATLPSFSSRVIVGQARKTETPIVWAPMTEIQFRPYWNIPRSIVRNEVLPAVARQPDYLVRQNMELVAGERDDSPIVAATPENLNRLAAGTLRIRQRPGAANSLGLIKFSFPNPHDVYMHATPARSLFSRDRRDFSHGCIRVEDTTGLAEWLLGPQGGWDRVRIAAAMDAATSSRVALGTSVRVLLFYATASFVPGSSDIAFAEDIYGLDARLVAELARRPHTGLPAANAPGVDVDEVGRRIEPDTAAFDSERRASELRERYVSEADIDRLPLHVKASGSDALRTLTQHGVGAR